MKVILDENSAFAQIRSVSAEISTSILESNSIHRTADVRLVVAQLASEKGAKFFRSEVRTNAWLSIVPDSGKWSAPDRYSNDIAIYLPEKIRIANLNEERFVGITFHGAKTNLNNRPAWSPMRVWELETNAVLKY